MVRVDVAAVKPESLSSVFDPYELAQVPTVGDLIKLVEVGEWGLVTMVTYLPDVGESALGDYPSAMVEALRVNSDEYYALSEKRVAEAAKHLSKR